MTFYYTHRSESCSTIFRGFLSYFDVFVSVHLISFYYYTLEACFLMRDRKVVDPDGRLNGEELGGVDGEKNSKKDVLYEKNWF